METRDQLDQGFSSSETRSGKSLGTRLAFWSRIHDNKLLLICGLAGHARIVILKLFFLNILLQVLSDKTASYRARLNKSEQNKKSQMKIMKKTHEVFIQQKDKLITDLQEILSEHEKTLAAQGGKGKKKGKGAKDLPGINRLVESITQLHEEKAKLSESMLVVQSELEASREEAMDNASKYRNQISDLQIEIKRLKSSSEQV